MNPPDKNKLIEKYFHEFHGMVCQALTWSSRDNSDLSKVMTRNAERIKEIVRQMVDDVYPPSVGDAKPAPAKGMPPTQRAATPGGR